MRKAIIIGAGDLKLLGALLIVVADTAKLAVYCTGVLFWDRRLIAIKDGCVIDTNDLDVEDGLHTARTTTLSVGREVVRKDIRDDGILA